MLPWHLQSYAGTVKLSHKCFAIRLFKVLNVVFKSLKGVLKFSSSTACKALAALVKNVKLSHKCFAIRLLAWEGQWEL